MSDRDKEDRFWWVERLSEGGIIVGLCATAEHGISYGHFHDEDKEICHGKIGLGALVIFSIIRIGCAVVRATRPKCPCCNGQLTYVLRQKKYYCNNCRQSI